MSRNGEPNPESAAFTAIALIAIVLIVILAALRARFQSPLPSDSTALSSGERVDSGGSFASKDV